MLGVLLYVEDRGFMNRYVFFILFIGILFVSLSACFDSHNNLGPNGFDDERMNGALCEDQIEAFSPCGGDLLGTWTLESNCTVRKVDSYSNYDEAIDDFDDGFDDYPNELWCPEKTSTPHQYYKDLEWTFGSNGKLTASSHTVIDTWRTIAPLSCFEGSMKCEDENDNKTVCSGGSICICTKTTDERFREAKQTTYEIIGSTLRLSDGRESARYCVQGQTLVVLFQDSSGKFLRRFVK